MTRPFDKHLDRDELDRVVSSHNSGQPPEQALEEARRHVESCQDCSRQMQMHESVQSEILRMRAPNASPPTLDCVGDAEWLELAAGLLPDAKSRELMKHAAQCGHCGPLLKNAAETLANDTTPGEETVLASLGSARPDWQKNLASRLRASAGPKGNNRERKEGPRWWRAFFFWPRPVFALAAIVVAITASWLGFKMVRPRSAEQLLAQAYADHRTLEVRISGAKYAPMRVERSTSGSNLEKSPLLLQAEALIAENLQKHPNQPAWLQAKARADLLDGNYESAIKTLQKALETEPDSPTLLIDLGSAYFERAESADRAIDYGNAIEELGKALAKSPDDRVALFNRALVCNRTFLYRQAVDDWEHYLHIDPQGDWADEARKRLADVKEKLKQHEKSQAEPLLEPESFAELVEGSDENAKAVVDRRVEDYITVALTKWLPAAFPGGSHPSHSPSETAARKGLLALATLLAQRHYDQWLNDLLSEPTSSNTRAGIEALGNSKQADEEGDPSTAELYASNAARLFRLSRNDPGLLRARLEEVYALQRAAKSDKCLKVLIPLRRELQGKRYTWMDGQSLLEGMACWGMAGNLQSSGQDGQAAVNSTERSRYGALHLRSLAFMAFLATEKGDEDSSWARNFSGLREYWSAPYPAIRGYQFYADLADDAESSNRGYVARALWTEATEAVALTPNRSGEAMARYRLATASLMTGDSFTAEQEFRNAGQLFNKLPQNQSTRTYEMDSEVALASLLVDRDDANGALQLLNGVRSRLNEVTDYHVAIDFHRALGKVYLEQLEYGRAEDSFRTAILLGERSARFLGSESERLTWDREIGTAYRGLINTYNRENRNPAETVALWERYRSLALRAARPTTRQPSNSRVVPSQDVLEDMGRPSLNAALNQLTEETVVAFDIQPDGIITWDFDNRGVRSSWLPISSQTLSAVASRFIAECSNPNSNIASLQNDSRQLYRWLIRPIENHLERGRTLVIEPDGLLDNVPVQALSDDQGRYIGAQYTMVWSLGFWYQQQLRSDTPFTSSDRVLVVGAPSVGPRLYSSLPALPDALNEARSVASMFSNATLLSGSGATLAAVENKLPGTQIFHFAGHALSGVQQNGLLLASPGQREVEMEVGAESLLEASRLRTSSFTQCHLAVLSACQTALGKKPSMADPSGLVRTFLRLNVPHVVATRWNIDSATSRQFTDAFYPHLLLGQSVSQAVQIAAQSIMTNPNTAHPYYWAAFAAFGRK